MPKQPTAEEITKAAGLPGNQPEVAPTAQDATVEKILETTAPTDPQMLSKDFVKDQAAMASEESAITPLTQKDLDRYREYDVNFSPYLDWNQQLAQNQQWYEEALNGLGRITAKLPATVLQNFATLFDADQIFDPDPEFTGNAFYEALEEYKQAVDEELPIFRKNPNESFAWGDSAWWMENISGVTESAAAFVISAYITGGALGKVFGGIARGGKYLQALQNGRSAAVAARMAGVLSPEASALVKGTGAFTNALLTNHMEGFGVGLQTMKSAREVALAEGKSLEEANKLASEAAALAYNTNRLNLALNLSSAGAFVTAPRHTRQLIKQMNMQNSLRALGYEAGQEFLEEEINHVAQKRGEAHARGEEYGAGDALNDMLTAEGLESGFWGAIGGLGQTSLTNVKNVLPTQRDGEGRRSTMSLHNEKYRKQQEILEQYETIAKANGVESATAAFRTAVEMNQLFTDISNAIEAGDDERASQLREQLVDVQALNAFENGTTKKLVKMYEDIRDGDPKEGMEENPDSKNYYKKKAQEAIDKIYGLEKHYIDSEQFLNGKEVFTNRANRDNFSKVAAGKREIKNQKQAELTNDILSAQEAGVIPSVYKVSTPELKTEDTTPGIKITGEELTTTEFPITVDPVTNQVVEDPNIPEEVRENVNSRIRGLESFSEFEQASQEYQTAENAVRTLDESYKFMTSNAEQERLLAAERQQARLIREIQEEQEQKKKATGKKTTKAQALNAVKKEEGVSQDVKPETTTNLEAGAVPSTEQIMEMATKETTVGLGDFISAQENPVEVAEGEAGDVPLPPEYTEAVADPEPTVPPTPEDRAIFLEHAHREFKEDAEDIYTASKNNIVDDEVDKIEETVSKSGNMGVGEDGTTYLGDKTTYAPNILAYLARDYETIKTTKDGKVTVKKKDIDDNLLETLDLDLVTKVKEGTKVEVRVYDPTAEEMKAWGVTEDDLKNVDQVPIGVFLPGKAEPSAFLHTVDWISPANVDGSIVPLEQQVNDLRKIREQVLAGPISVEVSFKSLGNLIKTHDNSFNTVSEALPDPKLRFAFVRNGELIGSKPDEGEFADLNIVNQDSIGDYNGMLVSLMPMQGKQAGDKDAAYIAVPLRRKKVAPEHVESMVNAVRLWWRAQNGLLDEKDNATMSKLQNFFPEDYKSPQGLEAYMRNFVHGQSIKERIDLVNKAVGLESDSYLLGFDNGNSIYWTRGGANKDTSVRFINKATPSGEVEAKLEQLKAHLSGMHINANFLNPMNASLGLPILGEDVTWIDSTYQDFLKENSETNLLSFKDRNGNFVYSIQHQIGLDFDVQETPVQENSDGKVVEEESRTHDIGDDSFSFDFDMVDDLDSFDDLGGLDVFRDVEENLRKEFLLDGFTPGQHNAIVDFVAYGINKQIIKEFDSGVKVSSKKAQTDKIKAVFTKGRVDAKAAGKDKAVALFDKILDSWSDIGRFVDKELVRMKTLSVEGDLALSTFELGGADLDKKSFEDDASLRVDGKKTMSAKLKRFLSAVPDVEDDGTPKKAILGLPKLVEFDTAYNTVSGILAGSRPDFDEQMTRLKKASEGQPWLGSLIKTLKAADSATRNEFASAMAKHYIDMQAVLWSVDKGKYSLKVAPVNANAVGRSIQEQWANDIQNASFITDPSDPNEFVINQDKADSLLANYKGISAQSPEVVFGWLDELGIELSPKAKQHLVNNGLRYGNRNWTFAQLFRTGGLFDNIRKSIETLKRTETSLANSDLTSNSAVRALAVLEASYNPLYFSNSFKNGENKTVYSYTPNKYLVNRVRDLKTDSQLVDTLARVPFSMHSKWLKELQKAQEGKTSYFAENFDMFYFDTLGQEGSRKRGSSAINMTAAEQEIFRLGLFQNRGTSSDGVRQAKVLYPTTSDKKVPHGLTVTAHNTVINRDGTIGEATINEVYENVVLPEIERILHYQRNKGEFNIKGYENGAGMFLFMPELNTVAELYDENGDLDANILSTTSEKASTQRASIKGQIDSVLRNAIEEKLDDWANLGIGEKVEGGHTFLDQDYMSKVARNDVNYAAADFVINTMIANANIFQTMIGDPAVYYKSKVPVKVDGVYTRSAEDTAAYVKASADTFENIGKRLAGDIAPGIEISGAQGPGYKNFYRQAFLVDREVASEAMAYYEDVLGEVGAKPYKKIEGTDAQEMTTLDEHLFVMNRLGKIGDKTYHEVLDLMKHHGDDLVLTPAQLKEVLQPMKPVYVNNKIEYIKGQPAVDTRIYVKSSSFPLIPQFTKGTGLETLRKEMEKNNIDRVAYATATKVGMSATPANPWGGDGDTMVLADGALSASVKTLDRSGFRIQQEVPFKEDKSKINDGTQQRKLLFSNILEVGNFEYKGEKLSGSELRDKYNALYNELFKEASEGFKKKVYNEDGTLNKKKLHDILIQEAREQNYPENDILALQLDDGEFTLPLWSSMSADKFEALINGLVDSNVRKQKVRGNSFVLGSQDGVTPVLDWADLPASQRNSIVYTKDFDPTKGVQARDKDGFAQIMISNKFKTPTGRVINLKKYIGEDGLIDDTKMPQEVREMFAYRIPTQGLNSMAKVRVVGILPDVMGDLVIAPREWTIQMGSDFDIDKLYVNMFNTVEVDGVLKKVEEGRKGIENDLLDVHLSVLSNNAKEVQSQIVNPLGFGWLKEGTTKDISSDRQNLAATISGAKGSSNFKFNPLGPSYQRTKYINATAGKAGVGVFSLDSTLNASMQGHSISFGGNKFQPIRFGEDVSNGELSNIYTLRSERTNDPEMKRYKSDVIAAYQSAAVDNEKEQILDKLNINSDTFDAIRAMNQMGFEEDVTMAFINQPAVIDYINTLKRLKDSTSGYVANADTKAYLETLQKYSDTQDTPWTDLTSDAKEVYEKKADEGYDYMMEQITQKAPNGYVQIAFLNKFLDITQLGMKLKGIQAAINTDSAGVSPNILENITKEEKVVTLGDESSGLVVNNASELIGEYVYETEEGFVRSYMTRDGRYETVTIKPTTINGYASTYALFQANEITRELYPFFDNKTFDTMIFDIRRITPESDEDITREADQKKRIWKEFRKYLNSTAFVEDPTAERNRLFFDRDGNKSLATRIKEVKELRIFRDNSFIQRLSPNIQNGTKPSVVRYNASASENEIENRLYAGFIDLVRSETFLDDDYTTRDLADGLVKAAFIEGGIQEAIQYVRYIPMSYLTKGGFAARMKSINWNDTESTIGPQGSKRYDVNSFTKQYYQHNPAEAAVVEKDELKSGKPGSEIIELTDAAKDKHGIPSKDGSLAPVFVAVPNKAALKKFELYQLSPSKKDGKLVETYKKIGTKGTFGMSEYHMLADTPSSMKSNVAKKKPKSTTVGLDAFVPTAEPETSTRPNTQKVTPFEKYGLRKGNAKLSGVATTKRVLETIANRSDNAMNRYLAEQYLDYIDDLGITTRDVKSQGELVNPVTGTTSKGRSDYATGEIILNSYKLTSDRELEHAMLHELTHHITNAGVRKGLSEGSTAVKNLTAIKDILKREIEAGKVTVNEKQAQYLNYIFSGNERRQLQELTAFAMSNPEIQSLLKSVSYRSGDQTFWNKLVEAWGKILEAMGITGEDNLLAATLDNVLTIVEKAPARPTSSTDVTRVTDLSSFMNGELGDVVDDLVDEGVLEEGEMTSEDIFLSLQPLVQAGIIDGNLSSIKEALRNQKNC